MAEIGVAYVNIIPKTDDFSSTVADASKEAGEAGGRSIGSGVMETLQSTVGDLFGTGNEMGSSLTSGMESYLGGAGKLAIGAAVAAIGVAALAELEKIGEEIDEMTDAIIVGTGASGEQLEEMRQIALRMSQDVAISFADSGDIIQDFNTRLNLTGEDLQTVATHAAMLDHILGGINYDNMARMFNVWGVGADEMTTKMDYLFGVSQNTGISFDSLTSIMQTSGPTLQMLGFSFEESANMAGLLDKAGIDASSTMSKMSKALVELSAPGESAQEAFRRVVGEMQGYIETGDEAAAMDLAEELFGTRGAAQFIAALQSGAFEMDNLSDAALGASGNIEETYAATEDWPEQWQRIQNSIAAALEPIATGVFSTIGTILEGIGDAMNFIWEKSEPVREVIGNIADGIGQRLQPVIEAVTPFFSTLGDILGNVVQVAFEGIAAAIQTVADIISWVWDNVLKPFADWCSETFGPIIEAVGGFFQRTGEVMSTSMEQANDAIIDSTSYMYGNVDQDWKNLRMAADGTWYYIDDTIESNVGDAEYAVDQATSNIESDMEFNGVASSASSEFSAAENAIEIPIENAENHVRSAPRSIIDAFYNLGNEITWAIGSVDFPTPHIDWWYIDVMGSTVSLPNVQWYAKGGFVDGATLIGAGEKGPEMILPMQGGLMDSFADALAGKLPSAGVDIHDCTFNVRKDSDIRAVAVELNTLVSRQMAGGIA